jgi:hypothetical protein
MIRQIIPGGAGSYPAGTEHASVPVVSEALNPTDAGVSPEYTKRSSRL